MTDRSFPLPLSGLVHVRNTLTQYREVDPGELVVIDADGVRSIQFAPPALDAAPGFATAIGVFGLCLTAAVALGGVEVVRGRAKDTRGGGCASVVCGLLTVCGGVRLLAGRPPVPAADEVLVLIAIASALGYVLAGWVALVARRDYLDWREASGLPVPARRGMAVDLASAPHRLPRLAAAAAGLWVALGALGLVNSLALMAAGDWERPEAPRGRNAPPRPVWPRATPCYGLLAFALLPVGCLVLAGRARDVLLSAVVSAVVGLVGVLSGLFAITAAFDPRLPDPPGTTALGCALAALGLLGHLLAAALALLARGDYLAWRAGASWQAGAALRDYKAWREARSDPDGRPPGPE